MKFGLAGLAAGASTAWVTDRVWNYLGPMIPTAGHGVVTHAALVAVAAGSLTSLMIFAGDRALETMIDMTNDPLYRTTYYQAVFLGSSTARSALSNVQVVLGTLLTPPSSGIPAGSGGPAKYTPPPKGGYGGVGPVMQQPQATPVATMQKAVPSCQSGMSCGAIML